MENKNQDVIFMQEALKEARKAASKGEVPVGVVAVLDGRIIGRTHNIREATGNPLGHAEILLIQGLIDEGRWTKGDGRSWRLTDTTIYVTLEPCLMCMGAFLQARIKRLVFGALDPKAGACGSLYNVSNDKRLNHRVDVVRGVLAEECGGLLKEFFEKLRM